MLQFKGIRESFMQKIIIASDHGGYNLKNQIINHLKETDAEVEDYGCYNTESCDYPLYAQKVADVVSKNPDIKGILVCGTGMTRMHNDSNILCLGERITGAGLALDIVDIWLNTAFEGGRHKKRIDMI